jgi:hypothetical protein
MSTDKIIDAILDENAKLATDEIRNSLFARAASALQEKRKEADDILFAEETKKKKASNKLLHKSKEMYNSIDGIEEEEELSKEQKAYRKVFDKMLKKYEVSSPAELDDEKKREFFSELAFVWSKDPANDTSGEGEEIN